MARKKDIRSALQVGQSMAEAALKRRRRAMSTRANALKKSPTLVSRSIVATAKGAPLKALAQATVASASAGVIIAEGDSWFDYPFNDVLSDLEDIHGYDVESVAHMGDTVEGMAFAGGQLDAFSRRVEKVLRNGLVPKAILLSGGGNDVAGDEFAILLNHAASSIAGLNESIVTGVIDERTQNAYVTILRAITTICQSQIGTTVPILVHGYDYPVPDGRGVLGGLGPLPGPWLEPGFRSKGYQAMATRQAIVVALIDRFNTMLARLAGKPPFAHVKHVDLRGTLSTGPQYKQWWANELHPTGKGFEAVTAKFVAAL